MEDSTQQLITKLDGQSDGLGEDSFNSPISQSLRDYWISTKIKILQIQFPYSFVTALARRVPRPGKSNGGGGQTN